METGKYISKYRIPSTRVIWHDYGGGAYFVTVCTKDMEHSFGRIISEQMEYTTVGAFLNESIGCASQHYPYCSIPFYIVMPNHWHAIVFIDGEKTPYKRRSGSRDGACPVLINTLHNVDGACPVSTMLVDKNEQMQQIESQKPWLSVVIGSIKSAVTKFANENNISFAWQSRFHDHIIRDINDMNRIADYIENNPTTWEIDRYNKL